MAIRRLLGADDSVERIDAILESESTVQESYKSCEEKKRMKAQSIDSGCSISDLRVVAVLLFVILNLAVFLLRLVSVWHYGSFFPTTGSEAPMIYSVWKRMHNLPVYEAPFTYPFSLSLYNYLFYDTYAAFLKLFGIWDAEIMTRGRLFTSVFAIMGAIAQWKLVQNTLNLRGVRSVLSLVFALGLWICTSAIRTWPLTIRPDLGAVALVMVALWMVVRQQRFGFAYAGVFFYLAWSFKQSVVLALVGVCLFLLFEKRWRDLSLLAGVCAALTAVTLLLGTPEYRFGILMAVRFVKNWSVAHAFNYAAPFVIANAYWIAAPIALLLAARGRRIDSTIRLLTTVFAISMVAGLVAMTKEGASDNYLLEAFVAGSTLLQLAVFTVPGRLVSALVLFGCILPAIQVATVPTGRYRHRFGTVGIANEAEYADAVALRDRLALMKKPIFTTDEIFSLPWISTGNRAPAFVTDKWVHAATQDLYRDGGLEGMLQRGEFPTVMLNSSNLQYLKSLNPKYEKVGQAFESDTLYSIYAIDTRVPDPNSSAR